MVRATVERDCAFRLRIAYRLPRPASLEELDEVIEGEVRLDAFSRLVPGARDLFRFMISDVSLATGSVGGAELVVSYGKLGVDASPVDQQDFEAFLEATYGAVQFHSMVD